MQFIKSIFRAVTKTAQAVESTADVGSIYADSWKLDAFNDLKKDENETNDELVARLKTVNDYCDRNIK